MKNKISIECLIEKIVFFIAGCLFLFFGFAVAIWDNMHIPEGYQMGYIEEIIGIVPFNIISGIICLGISICFFGLSFEIRLNRGTKHEK